MVTFCSWHGRALVAFGLLSSSSESLLLPHSSRAIAVGGRRPGLRITTRLWTDPATDGSGDSQSTQETRDALLSRLQQEKDDLIAKKLELEQALVSTFCSSDYYSLRTVKFNCLEPIIPLFHRKQRRTPKRNMQLTAPQSTPRLQMHLQPPTRWVSTPHQSGTLTR